MPQAKHTRCGGCRTSGHWRQFELMWRVDGAGPWTWLNTWCCARCRAGLIAGLAGFGVQLVLWDG